MARPEKMSLKEIDEETGLLEETETPHQRCLNAMRIDWRLVLFKVQYFFLMGAESVDRVYFQLFLQQAGQSPTQIGIISGVAPFVVCLTDSFGVSLASKFRRIKGVMLFVSLSGALVAFGTAFLPMPVPVSNCTLGISDTANMSSLESQFGLGISDADESSPEGQPEEGWLYEEDDVIKFFYVAMIVHIAFSVLRNLTLAFTDVALFSVLGEKGMNKYSLQKAFGNLGSTFLDLGTGAIIGLAIYTTTICGIEVPVSNYRIAFYVIGSIMLICFLCSWTFKFETKKRAHKVPSLPCSTEIGTETNSSSLLAKEVKTEADVAKLKDEDSQFSPQRLINMFFSVHYMSWSLTASYMGFSLAIANFAYLYLEMLGGDAYLTGVVSGVTCGFEFVFCILSYWIVPKIGSINSMILVLLGYAIRFAFMAMIQDPWLALLQTVIGGFSHAVGWIATMHHAVETFKKADRPAVIGIIHGLYFGLGLGTGEVTGGALIDIIGAKYMYAVMTGITLVVLGMFCLAQKLSKRPLCDMLSVKET